MSNNSPESAPKIEGRKSAARGVIFSGAIVAAFGALEGVRPETLSRNLSDGSLSLDMGIGAIFAGIAALLVARNASRPN